MPNHFEYINKVELIEAQCVIGDANIYLVCIYSL